MPLRSFPPRTLSGLLGSLLVLVCACAKETPPVSLTALSVSPASLALRTGEQRTPDLLILATWSDGTVEDVSTQARRVSSDPSLLGTFPDGSVLGFGPGSAELRLSFGGLELKVPVSLHGASLERLRLELSHDKLPMKLGAGTAFGVTAEFSDGEEVDVTSLVEVSVWGETLSVPEAGRLEVTALEPLTFLSEQVSVVLAGRSATRGIRLYGRRLFVEEESFGIQVFGMTTPPDGVVGPIGSERPAGAISPQGFHYDPIHDELWLGYLSLYSTPGGRISVMRDLRTRHSTEARSITLSAYAVRALAYDPQRDLLYAVVTLQEGGGDIIQVFERARSLASGEAAPSREIRMVPDTADVRSLTSIHLDWERDQLFLTTGEEGEPGDVYVIDGASEADGDLSASPKVRTLEHHLAAPLALTLDGERSRLYVASSAGRVFVLDPERPFTVLATLEGEASQLSPGHPSVALDAETGALYVGSQGKTEPYVVVFENAHALEEGTGEQVPVRRFWGANGSLSQNLSMAIVW